MGSSNNGEINKIEDKDWVNVYGIEEFSFDRDEDMRNIPGIDPSEIEPWIITGKIYTIYYNGEIRYLVQEWKVGKHLLIIPETGFSKTSVAKTQTICLE